MHLSLVCWRKAICAMLLLVSPIAFACPDCQYEQCVFGACVCLPTSGCIIPPPFDPGKIIEKLKVDPVGALINPMGVYNPTGIPLPGDVAEFAIKNPDQAIGLISDPGRALYLPVVTAIIAGRNAVINGGGQLVPENIKPFLRHWYSPELINSVRWSSQWSLVNNTLQAAQMNINSDTRAISLINAVVFRNDAAAHDPALWAHEMVHIDQYRQWGVTDFARSWVNNSSEGGPVEAPAYARGAEAELLLVSADITNDPVRPDSPIVVENMHPQKFPTGAMLGQCGCWGSVSPYFSVAAPACQSGIEGPQICGPVNACGGGSAPWVRACR